LPVISNGINFMRNKFMAVPAKLSKYGIWIGIIGFVVIVMTEHASHMFIEARATGVLLFTILSGAVITTSLFGKRSWCKHICPLGKVVGHFADLSVVELGSNTNVCSSQCQTHDCVKDKNCPMGIHPSVAASTTDCILCLACVKRCQHKSARINARFPWQNMIGREKWELPGAMFTTLLVASVLAVKLPSWGLLDRYIAIHISGFQAGGTFVTDILLSCIFLFVFTAMVFLAAGFAGREKWRENFVRVAPSYLFIAFAGFLNIYLHEFIYDGHNLIPWLLEAVGLGGIVPIDLVTPNLGTLKVLIPLITLTGATTSLLMLKAIADKYSLPRMTYRSHQVIILLTLVAFLFIL
jgi:hypothetical protein